MEDNLNPSVQANNIPENNQTFPHRPKANPLVIVSLILLLLLVSAGSFVLGKYFTSFQEQPEITQAIKPIKTTSPTPSFDPTINWKTYTNNKYSFSFKYPPDSRILGDMQSTTFTLLINNNPVTILISNNSQKEETENLFLTIVGGKDHSLFEDKVTFSKIVIGENQFTLAEQDSAYFKLQAGGFSNLIFTGENYLVIFKHSKEGRKELDQILSTFRFLDDSEKPTTVATNQEPEPTSSPEIVLKYNVPEGWKTTEKIENLYTVSYDPKNWQQSCYKGCSILLTKNQIYHFQTYTLPYDGGSRRALLQKQFTGPFEEFVEIEIDGKRGLMAPLKWNANFDNEIIFGFPRGDKMIIIKTNLLIVYGEKTSGFDKDYLYKFLGTLKID